MRIKKPVLNVLGDSACTTAPGLVMQVRVRVPGASELILWDLARPRRRELFSHLADSYLVAIVLVTGYRTEVTMYKAGICDRSDFGVALLPSVFGKFSLQVTDVSRVIRGDKIHGAKQKLVSS